LFNRILIAIDGSDHSQKALQYSIEFAKKWNAELLLVSVVPSFPPHLTAGPGFNIDQYILELEKSYEKILKEAEEYVKKIKPVINVSTKLGNGSPADVIIDTAEKENVDLIIMGSRGYGGITGWILGSTSRYVVEACTKPILIIK
jgi:nucleotide-binding universal stress UspA family protein